jgi:endonuclease-3
MSRPPLPPPGDPARFDIGVAVRVLRKAIKRWKTPVVTMYSRANVRPAFQVLISCVLSLRTRDEQTSAASARLFAVADTPERIAALPVARIEKLIYPVGFYRTKAVNVKKVCRILVDEYGGAVPDEIDTLLTLPGVGRKTANLVVTLGFGKPGICVDTHVHRLCRIWGYVAAKNPDATERALRAKLPKRYWIEFNDLLVSFGQNLCHPVSPKCSICPLLACCPRLGVTTHR